MHLRCKFNGRGVGHGGSGPAITDVGPSRQDGARAQYTCRTGGVQGEDARAIKVRNAREMVLWWDAQVPDRLP
ncbi:hypothetical protein C3492_08025 [Streptomyces sp. Ru62]|nr:hypothetical protein C3492_08025 [Streptomyces sp. Ru62]